MKAIPSNKYFFAFFQVFSRRKISEVVNWRSFEGEMIRFVHEGIEEREIPFDDDPLFTSVLNIEIDELKESSE